MMKLLKDKALTSIFHIFLLAVSFAACNQDKKQVATNQYTCPMHPEIVKNEPGTCPICHMDLVALKHEDLHTEVDANLQDVIQSSNKVLSTVKMIRPSLETLNDTLTLQGVVAYNTNNQRTISSFISGRIERLYVKYNFQEVKKGEKLMEIYSPDLAAAQQEILYLQKVKDTELLEQAKNKIRLLGATEQQIKQLLRSGKVNYSLAIYSPFSGYLMEESITNTQTQSPNSMKGNNNMSSSNTSVNTNTTPFNLREGMYVNTGQVLFRLFNSSSVWAEFFAEAEQLKAIKKGTLINIKGASIENIQARITLIQPFFKEGRNFPTVRVAVSNSDKKLKIGELLGGKIISPPIQGLWLPKSAVYSLGSRSVVFVRSKNVLMPKEVFPGPTINNRIVINKGLKATDEVAENANYLFDSESFILK